jgi:hypothetical protein
MYETPWVKRGLPLLDVTSRVMVEEVVKLSWPEKVDVMLTEWLPGSGTQLGDPGWLPFRKVVSVKRICTGKRESSQATGVLKRRTERERPVLVVEVDEPSRNTVPGYTADRVVRCCSTKTLIWYPVTRIKPSTTQMPTRPR